jgi:hypothetical protein
MPNEPEELTHARVLLARFESEMERPEGLVHLSKALSLLGDIRADSESQNVRQVASNLPLAYAKKVQARVAPLLSPELPVHWERLEHWEEVFGEFESFDFALPQDIARTRLELQMKKTNKENKLMSPGKRKKLLEQLQAI